MCAEKLRNDRAWLPKNTAFPPPTIYLKTVPHSFQRAYERKSNTGRLVNRRVVESRRCMSQWNGRTIVATFTREAWRQWRGLDTDNADDNLTFDFPAPSHQDGRRVSDEKRANSITAEWKPLLLV